MGYASGRTPVRPVFWEFRNRRVFVAQIPLVCTIDTLIRFPQRILIIVLIASAVTFPTDRRNLPLEQNGFPPPKKGEGSLHPRPEGRGIRDPPRSRCKKLDEEIEKKMVPFQKESKLIQTIPGISEVNVSIRSEISL